MADDTHPVHAQQHGPARAVGVEVGGEREELRVQGRGGLGGLGPRQDLGEGPDQEPERPLHGLERHVAGEAVRHHHVSGVVEEVATFDIADEVEPRPAGARGQLGMGLFLQGRSLGLLLPDGQQGHPRSLHPVALAGERRPHLGELHQHRRRALGVGPGIQQHGGPGPMEVGDRGGDGRPDHIGQAPHPQQSRGHGGPGVPGGDHGHGPAVTDRLGRPHQGRVLLPPDTLPGVVVHADDLAGREAREVTGVAHGPGTSHECHGDAGLLGHLSCPGHDLVGSPVAAHGVDRHRK